MSTLVGKQAPFFKTTAVFSGEFKETSLKEYLGQYVVLFFYPLDFTFVCPTELHAFQDNLDTFKSLNTTILGCSIDSQFCHKAWLETPRVNGGIQGVEYGLLADIGGKIAYQYGVLSDEGVAYRGLFLIDPKGVIRHVVVNDLPLGRSVAETIRMVEALHHVESVGEVCPADWNKTKPALHANHDSVSQYLQKKYA